MGGFQKIYGVMSYLIDMFPRTTERTKTAVDQVGRTVRQMTYFLSSRAIAKQSVCLHEILNDGNEKQTIRYRYM